MQTTSYTPKYFFKIVGLVGFIFSVFLFCVHDVPAHAAGGFELRYKNIQKNILALSSAGRSKQSREHAERALSGLNSTLERLNEELEAERTTEKMIDGLRRDGATIQSEHSIQDINKALSICKKNQVELKKLINLTKTESKSLENFAKSLKPEGIDSAEDLIRH